MTSLYNTSVFIAKWWFPKEYQTNLPTALCFDAFATDKYIRHTKFCQFPAEWSGFRFRDILIYVRTNPSGKRHELRVRQHDSVASLKALIQEKAGISIRRQRLLFNGLSQYLSWLNFPVNLCASFTLQHVLFSRRRKSRIIRDLSESLSSFCITFYAHTYQKRLIVRTKAICIDPFFCLKSIIFR